MAQQKYRVDLTDTVFPMLSEQLGATIIGSSTREAAGASGYEENRPRIMYCENVVPTKHGINSVGYRDAIPAISLSPGNYVTDTRHIFGDAGTRIELTWDNDGNMFANILNSGVWISIADPTPSILSPTFSVNDITIGTVDMVSYIYFRGIGCFTYDEDTDTLQAVTLTGLSISTLTGVSASHGYLIGYTRTALAWSSTVDPTDFTPSTITGAGGGKVAGLRGLILFAVESDVGIVVYSADNAVAATYTGNVKYPFKLRPIANSKGGVLLDKVAYEANAKEHYLYSQAGLQSVNSQGAKPILPEVTDFLAGKRIETYDTVTRTFTVTDLDDVSNLRKKIKLIGSRYLIISYGIVGLEPIYFQYAIVYDIALNKLGKLKVDHSDVFELHRAGIEDTKEQIAFMQHDGKAITLDFIVGRASSGVLILGKLQFTRTRLMQLLGVTVENIESADTLSVSSNVALDGKNFTNTEGVLLHTDSNIREYGFRDVGKNHAIVLIGEFNTVSIEATFAVDGRE